MEAKISPNSSGNFRQRGVKFDNLEGGEMKDYNVSQVIVTQMYINKKWGEQGYVTIWFENFYISKIKALNLRNIYRRVTLARTKIITSIFIVVIFRFFFSEVDSHRLKAGLLTRADTFQMTNLARRVRSNK